MFRVITENLQTYEMELVKEFTTFDEAREYRGNLKRAERNANEYWIINVDTGEIL